MQTTQKFNPLSGNFDLVSLPSYNTFATVALARLGTSAGSETPVCFVAEKEALYVYCSACASPDDGDLVFVTGNGGNSRWVMLQKISRTQGDTGWVDRDGAILTELSTTAVRLTLSSTAIIAIRSMRYGLVAGNYDLTITGAAGTKYLYFDDGTGTIKQRDTFWDFTTQVTVAVIQWDGTSIVSAQTEYHGIRDTVWHSWAHLYLGTQYRSGLTFTTNVQTDNNSDPNVDTVQYLWSTTGVVQDEDAVITVGTGNWVQTLGSGLTSATAAIIPFLYYNGTTIARLAAMADRTPFIHAGGNTAPQWNNGGTLQAATTGQYAVYHYFASANVGGYCVFARPHTAIFTSLTLAQGARPSSLTWDGISEYKHLYSIVFRVNTGWAPVPSHGCKIVNVQDFRTVPGTPGASTNATAHSALSGLTDPNTHPATSISAVPVSGQLNPAVETDVELAIDRLSEYGGVLTYTAAKVYRAGNIIRIDGYMFRVVAGFIASTWATDYGDCELINVPTVNTSGGLRALGGSFNKVVWLGLVSEYGKFYEFKTGTVTARGIPDIDGVGYYDPIETNFERFAHANSFAVGDVCYRIDGSTWGKAKADSEATIQTIGVISFVNGNVFHVTYGGVIQLSGRTAATSYFVSDTTAGLATTTRPTTVGNFDAPIYDALTTTLVMVRPLRAVVIGSTNVKTTIGLANNAATTILNVSAYAGGRIEGELFIDATADTKAWYEIKFVKAADGNYYGSASFVGDALTGLSLAVTNAGLVQFTLPSVTGFASASYIYTLNGPAVGATFPLAISAGLVTGRVDGVAPGAGIIGETISATPTDTTATASDADVNNSSITLTAGRWRLEYNVTGYITTGASAGNNAQLKVKMTDSANTLVSGTEKIFTLKTVAAVANETYLSISGHAFVNLSAGATYKLRLSRGDLNGTNVAGVVRSAGFYENSITATRIG